MKAQYPVGIHERHPHRRIRRRGEGRRDHRRMQEDGHRRPAAPPSTNRSAASPASAPTRSRRSRTTTGALPSASASTPSRTSAPTSPTPSSRSARSAGTSNRFPTSSTASSTRNLNKKSLEAMIKSGAMDDLGERGNLFANLEDMLAYNHEAAKQNQNQVSLFGGAAAIAMPSFKLKETPPAAAAEKTALGKRTARPLYLGPSPSTALREKLESRDMNIKKIHEAVGKRHAGDRRRHHRLGAHHHHQEQRPHGLPEDHRSLRHHRGRWSSRNCSRITPTCSWPRNASPCRAKSPSATAKRASPSTP